MNFWKYDKLSYTFVPKILQDFLQWVRGPRAPGYFSGTLLGRKISRQGGGKGEPGEDMGRRCSTLSARWRICWIGFWFRSRIGLRTGEIGFLGLLRTWFRPRQGIIAIWAHHVGTPRPPSWPVSQWQSERAPRLLGNWARAEAKDEGSLIMEGRIGVSLGGGVAKSCMFGAFIWYTLYSDCQYYQQSTHKVLRLAFNWWTYYWRVLTIC